MSPVKMSIKNNENNILFGTELSCTIEGGVLCVIVCPPFWSSPLIIECLTEVSMSVNDCLPVCLNCRLL